MMQTTTPSIDGKSISAYHGVVTGKAILGANIFRDFFAGIRDIVGGRSAAYEKELQKAREIAFSEMSQKAREQGANGIVGIDIDPEYQQTLRVHRASEFSLCSIKGAFLRVGQFLGLPQFGQRRVHIGAGQPVAHGCDQVAIITRY